MLKIDTQGYELEVLKGARSTLQNIEFLLVEMSLIPVNSGAPLIQDIMSHLDASGFVLYDIAEFHRRPLDQALWQIDGLFAKKNSRWRANTHLGL
jgi:hypothetical protein